MLKLIGLGGIVISCGLIGIMKCTKLKQRVWLLEDFLQMILILRGQINYFREPLPQIFGKAGKKADSEAFELLGDAELRLREKDGEIARIWPEETDRIYGRLQVTAEDIEIFKYPGSFIGQTDYDNHIAHFDYLEEKLREQIREADSDFKTKSPMYSKIGFALGAMLAILFM